MKLKYPAAFKKVLLLTFLQSGDRVKGPAPGGNRREESASQVGTTIVMYRVSSKTVCTSILLFSRVPEYIQKNFWPFFNSPGDEDFKTHLTFLPT